MPAPDGGLGDQLQHRQVRYSGQPLGTCLWPQARLHRAREGHVTDQFSSPVAEEACSRSYGCKKLLIRFEGEDDSGVVWQQ